MGSANSPLISVIVPVYNTEEWVGECLSSIAAQTLSDFECIVIDDGSTDSSARIVDEYAAGDNRFRVVHQENCGVSVARNNGITRAGGRYIAFVDSDDCIQPTALEKLLETAELQQAAITMCDFLVLHGDDSVQVRLLDEVEGDYLNEHEYWSMSNEPSANAAVVVWGKLFRREVFDNVVFPEESVFEDIIAQRDIVSGNMPIALVKEPLYCYRKRLGSITSSGLNAASRLDVCDALLERDSYFAQRGWSDVRVSNLRTITSFLNLYYQNTAFCSGNDGLRYFELRRRTIALFWSLLPSVLIRPNYAIRIISYVIDERLHDVMKSVWRFKIVDLVKRR